MPAELLLVYPILIFSVIFHEVAHGLVALRHGDDTALLSGRLTLNPLSHIDPVGSIVFPLVCVALKMPVFGWAKPVPVNPNRFTHYRSGMIFVSLAGVGANFLIAVMAAVGLFVLGSYTSFLQSMPFLTTIFAQAILLNLILAVFNLVPIPPLDGSKVLSVLLPSELAARYDSLEPYGFMIVMALLAFGIMGRVVSPAVDFLYGILMRGVGFY
jgi:Zn-dependent protease